MEKLCLPSVWPYNHIQPDYLYATRVGTTFTGHRGNIFFKFIRIYTANPINLFAQISSNTDCILRVGEYAGQPHRKQPRMVKVLWYNAAQPVPGRIEARFPFKNHLKGLIDTESPNLLVFTCTGHGFSMHEIYTLVRSIKHTGCFKQDIGIDSGSFSVSCSGNANVVFNDDYGHNVEDGIEFHSTW